METVEDTIRALMPGVTDEHVARVVGVLALGEPSPSPTGTSSVGDSGLASPTAPSTPAPVAPVGVEPATDEQIAWMERAIAEPIDLTPVTSANMRALLARFRQEQATARDHRGAFHSISAEAIIYRRERDEARRERDAAVARAERHMRERDRAERERDMHWAEVARMRPLLDATCEWAQQQIDRIENRRQDAIGAGNVFEAYRAYRDAVRALRDAQEAGQ